VTPEVRSLPALRGAGRDRSGRIIQGGTSGFLTPCNSGRRCKFNFTSYRLLPGKVRSGSSLLGGAPREVRPGFFCFVTNTDCGWRSAGDSPRSGGGRPIQLWGPIPGETYRYTELVRSLRGRLENAMWEGQARIRPSRPVVPRPLACCKMGGGVEKTVEHDRRLSIN